jgi:hypothetical protein
MKYSGYKSRLGDVVEMTLKDMKLSFKAFTKAEEGLDMGTVNSVEFKSIEGHEYFAFVTLLTEGDKI